jgi:hypothetical protein
MTEEEEKKSFRVKDNRRFDSDGNERGDTPSAISAGSVSSQPSTPKDSTMSASSNSPETSAPGEEPGIDFSSFIVSLGTQALMQLGLIKPPEGMDMPADKVAAKQTIDIIAMLEEKTRGNLEEGEVKLITEILHSLRMSFVKVA